MAVITVHILVALQALAISSWLLHLVDYSIVGSFLGADKTWDLRDTVNLLNKASKSRAIATEGFRRAKHLGTNSEDSLPDREIGPGILEALLTALKEQLQELLKPLFLERIERYGNVVALFHPDYLPRLAHVYLKISQLRALNMAPRRIQLLGRRWTVRGLESEFVVVHDISELRPEYVEWSNAKRHVQAFLDATQIAQSGTRSDQPIEASAIQLAVPEDLLRTAAESKWRQRTLKKRAIVTVAPDGSLLSIAIEEERQFNI